MTEAKRKTSSMRPGLRALLVVSLALNILIVGVVAGAVINKPGKRGGHGHGPAADAVVAFSRALPREERRKLGRRIRDHFHQEQGDKWDGTAARENLLSALNADPFDKDALAAAMENQQKLFMARQGAAREVFLGFIAEMTHEERVEYATNVRKAFEDHKRRKHRKSED